MKRKIVSLLLVLSACLTLVTPAFASVNTANATDSVEVQPRSTIETVRDYYFILEDYNGNVTYTPWVYKDVVVPNGKALVCTNDSKPVYIKYDAYYNNVKYAMVAKIECVYELR